MGRSILVTGVARYLGSQVAAQLSALSDVDRVYAVDHATPKYDLGGAHFVRADIRNPVIGKVIARTGVDTVLHMGVIASPHAQDNRESMKEINVVGTMQLLSACQNNPSVRHVVVKSTGGIYGSSYLDPAAFVEERTAKVMPTSGWSKDSLDVEGYVRGFARRNPLVRVTVLRMAHVLGPTVQTFFTDFFRLPALPGVLGFDPRMQFLHEEDCTSALGQAALEAPAGIFNVAADGVLSLTQAAGILGKQILWMPRRAVAPYATVMRAPSVARIQNDALDYLTYGRVLDTHRMRSELGFEPSYSTAESLRDFAMAQGARGWLTPEAVLGWERATAAGLTQIRHLLLRGIR